MNHVLRFKTSMFDVTKEKENPVNPIYGISLLLWLKEELRDKVDITEPDAEDWGWYSELEWKGNNYLIGATAYFEEGDDPEGEIEWVFQIEKYRSLKEKLLGLNKYTESDTCFTFFKELFETHPDFSDVEIE